MELGLRSKSGTRARLLIGRGRTGDQSGAAKFVGSGCTSPMDSVPPGFVELQSYGIGASVD